MRIKILSSLLFVTGCGAVVPNLAVDRTDALYVEDVHNAIECELIDAAHIITDQAKVLYKKNKELGKKNIPKSDFLDEWGVLYNLTLVITENTGANPSIDLLTPTTPAADLLPGARVFTLNSGLGVSAKATRTETSQSFASIYVLSRKNKCIEKQNNRIIPIGNKLGIQKWMSGRLKLFYEGTIVSKNPKDAFTYQVKFEISKDLKIDPKWSFKERKFSGSNGLFNMGRASAHSVLVTFGPAEPNRLRLDFEARNLHVSRVIGSAVKE
jgi:hypothetical protein